MELNALPDKNCLLNHCTVSNTRQTDLSNRMWSEYVGQCVPRELLIGTRTISKMPGKKIL